MMGWYYGWSAWDWVWMAAMMVLFWGGVILLGVWAIRALAGPRHSGEQAIDVLRRRLAAGEITPEEFEKTKKALGA